MHACRMQCRLVSVLLSAVLALFWPAACSEAAPITDWTWTRRGDGPWATASRGAFTPERTGDEPTLLSFGISPDSNVTRWYPDGTWEHLPQSGSAPAPRWGFALGFSAGNLIVANGRDSSERFGDSFAYTVATGVWTQLSEGPSARSSTMSCTSVWNGTKHVFVFGGLGLQTVLSDVGAFNVQAETYVTVPTSGSVLSGRYGGVLAPSSNGAHILFQFGGITVNGNTLEYVPPNVHGLTATGTWELVGASTADGAPPPTAFPLGWFLPPFAGGGSSLGSVLVGFGSSVVSQDSLYFLDLATAMWSAPVVQGPGPSARFASFFARFESSGTAKSVFLLFGGEPENGADSGVYTLSPTLTVAVTTSPSTTATTARIPQATSATIATTTTTTTTTTTGSFTRTTTATTATIASTATSAAVSSVRSFAPGAGSEAGDDVSLLVGIIAGAACCVISCIALGAIWMRRKHRNKRQDAYRGSLELADCIVDQSDSDEEELVYDKILFAEVGSTSESNYARADKVAQGGSYAQIPDRAAIAGGTYHIAQAGVLPAAGVKNLSLEHVALDPRDILIDERARIGRGEYGDVFRGLVGELAVAIKMIKAEGASNDALLAFYDEAALVAAIAPHPHVVGLIGITPSPLMLVFELAENGSLLKYLRRASPLLSTQQVIKVIRDIASGMQHIASCGIVHRDLAARNVLLSRDLRPIVSDFGLSTQLQSGSSRHQSKSATGPFRHMAVESIKKGMFSEASDVWAFAVTAWESFTSGETPYRELRLTSSVEIIRRILDGYRLTFPARVPVQIERLLLRCWNVDPDQRPTFAAIIRELDMATSTGEPDVVYASLSRFSEFPDVSAFRTTSVT